MKNKKKEYDSNPPGRTFKRVLTGRYFGCENINSDALEIAKAKQEKIDQICELELKPMYIKYTYEKTKEQKYNTKLVSAHVAFQKEVFAQKWNMLHITEMSFTISQDDFDEFEQMSGINLSKDFKDLTPNSNTPVYQGVERRKDKR